jgi:hypothetical protein
MIDRTELVFYDISNDEILEMSRIENEFGFCSVDDKNKYIKIMEKIIMDDDILKKVKSEINKIKITDYE